MSTRRSLTLTASLLLTIHLSCIPAYAVDADSASHSAAVAPSFDCKKASGVAEKAICTDKSLAEMDAELAREFRTVLAQHSDARSDVLLSEQQWLAYRNTSCNGDENIASCLQTLYRDRISQLQSGNYAGPPACSGLQQDANATPSSMEYCQGEQEAYARIELAKVIKQALKSAYDARANSGDDAGSDAAREQLAEAQKAWENYLDADCDAIEQFTATAGGVAPFSGNECKMDLIKDRIDELRAAYDLPGLEPNRSP
jgi:uncharacterized protein YecT (DUF1311 family)